MYNLFFLSISSLEHTVFSLLGLQIPDLFVHLGAQGLSLVSSLIDRYQRDSWRHIEGA